MTKIRNFLDWLPFFGYSLLVVSWWVSIIALLLIIIHYLNIRAEWTRPISFGIGLVLLVGLGAYIIRALWFGRWAGKLVPEAGNSHYTLFIVLGAGAVIMWIVARGGPHFVMQDMRNGDLNGLPWAVIILLAGMNSLQVRENGLALHGKFIDFRNVQSFTWNNVNGVERLYVKLKHSPRTLELRIPMESRYLLGDYLKQKYPQLFHD